ncbi:MAG TPA: aminotransferase class V-fold PLP-dependent enzyme [Acidimicrobiales bacterium]|nr:aminotransferase class V-fold PLP-dependent enzyme [Acidimicrobiales bacterium]
MHPAAESEFDHLPITYVDTASYGLPPRATVRALSAALEGWVRGVADWQQDWDAVAEQCRPLAATLLGTSGDEVAFLPAVSVGAAVAFSRLGAADEVLLPDDEFASVLLPALAAAEGRGARIRLVPFRRLADEVTPDTTFVATSHVRSADGAVQDLHRVAEAAEAVGAVVVVDATHSAGVLPVESGDLGLDVVLCAAYKHLLCPRGVAFMTVSRRMRDRMPPIAASWRSTTARSRYYGPDLADLATSAARYDVSIAWHAWVGAVASLAFLCSVPAKERSSWPVELADSLAEALGMARSGSSLLAVPVSSGERARESLARAGVKVSGRGDAVRVSFHLYNDAADVTRAAECLEPLVVNELHPQRERKS